MPTEKKQQAMKVLNFCENSISTECFADFDI